MLVEHREYFALTVRCSATKPKSKTAVVLDDAIQAMCNQTWDKPFWQQEIAAKRDDKKVSEINALSCFNTRFESMLDFINFRYGIG